MARFLISFFTVSAVLLLGCTPDQELTTIVLKKDFVGTISGYDFDSQDSTIAIHQEIKSLIPVGV